MHKWSSAKSDIYFSPWVMRAAWNKTLNWYSTGEWFDPAEMLAWKAEPWRHLADLAADLSSGTYTPDPFPEIPYPKKGSLTRHYVIPSVRDQVAFMTFLVLLGPFLEARMPNTSFGNRLFRARVLKEPTGSSDNGTDRTKKWFTAPFSIVDRRVYAGFPGSYGLFRRLLQWLVNACVLGPETAERLGNELLSTEDPDRLPYWEFRKKKHRRPTDLVHARLDMRMTYPSVDRAILGDVLQGLLSNKIGDRLKHGDANDYDYSGMGRPSFPGLQSDSKGFQNWVEPRYDYGAEHPWQSLISCEDDRLQLAAQMMDALNAVQYVPWEVPREWKDNANSFAPCNQCGRLKCCAKKADTKEEWVGPHGYAPLVDGNGAEAGIVDRAAGLPTGLAISGMLLNAAFTPTDEAMVSLWRRTTKEGGLFFYLRFVDDVVMLADTGDRIEEGIRVLSGAARKFAGPKVQLNCAKAKPEGVRDFLVQKTGEFKPLDEFLTSQDYLTRSNLELFTTSVVREMSGLAEESLDERYGVPGVERLEQLMELATMEIDDFEVGADARLSFAVNKIASASWPQGDVVCDDKVITEKMFRERIFHIAETALRRHPWRFKLWRPILALAIRGSTRDMSGIEWLKESMLPLIAWFCGGKPRISNLSWEEQDARLCEDRNRGQKCAYLPQLLEAVRHRSRERCSFHRAEFFRQLSHCLSVLQRIAEPDGTRVSGGWASHLTCDDAKKVLRIFSDIRQFCDVIYGDWRWKRQEEPFVWWWEAEAIALTALTSRMFPKAISSSLPSPGPRQLRSSSSLGSSLLDELALGPKGGIQAPLFPVRIMHDGLMEPPREQGIPVHPVAWLAQYMGRWSSQKINLARRLIPGGSNVAWAGLSRLSDWGYLHDLIVTLEESSHPVPKVIHRSRLWHDFIIITDYTDLRRMMMAHGVSPRLGSFASWFPHVRMETGLEGCDSRCSLHHAMYCFDQVTDEFPNPSAAPAIGLNWQVAWDVVASLRKSLQDGGFICPSTVILKPEHHDFIVKYRHSGIVHGDSREFVAPVLGDDAVEVISAVRANHPAPHPLFLLSQTLCGGDGLAAVCYQQGALLLWMLSGGEFLLDQVLESFPWRLPFVERSGIRARYLVPDVIWYQVESELGMSRRMFPDKILAALEKYVETGYLELPRDKWISHIALDSQGNWTVGRPGIDDENVEPIRELFVRIVQASRSADFTKWKPSRRRPFFLENAGTMGGVPEEMAGRLHEAWSESRISCGSYGDGNERIRENIIMFPEWYADESSVRGLVKFCRDTGIAVLCGMLPRELPRAVPVVAAVRHKGLRCIVNEAVFIVPAYEKPPTKDSFCLPSQVYEFRIRKCMPNVSEVALVLHLQESIPDTRWRFVGGDTWFCLHHPSWGAFCVTICSDVLTTGKWRELHRTIQHLLIPARNQDVDLFDQVTWTRGYELYANAITVNHGDYGGSAVWTPKHRHGREILHVRGQKKGIAVVVGVPVAPLIKAQNEQFEKSVVREKDRWSRKRSGRKDSDEFKTPPPRVNHRNGE